MFTTLQHTISDCFAITRKNHLSFLKKTRLLSDYLRVVFKRFLHGRTSFMVNHSREKIGGFTIEMNNYSDFYWTFREVFIHEDYYFHTNKEDPFIIDCGGNIGIPVLYFKYLYPEAHITVFEALPENVELLQLNVKKNNLNNVTIIPKAVGYSVGELTIYGKGRAASVHKDLIKKEKDKNSSGEKDDGSTVFVDTLSSYINNHVNFLKVDIEGAESDVISELAEVKKLGMIEQIALEYHHFDKSKNSLASIVKAFEDHGFITVIVSDYGNLESMPETTSYRFMIYATRTASFIK